MGRRLERIETVLWSAPARDPVERRLLRKVDMFLMPYICLGYFVNYLDRANLANAYVTGMQEAVGFKGNDFTFANTLYNAGFMVGLAPAGFILSSNRIPARIFLPGCMAIWACFTIGQAFVKNPQQVWGLRFAQAFFEASTFCGSHYILGAWYKDNELGKRSALFISMNQVATLISGVLQGSIISTLDGRSGLEGWQWLYIIDFVITVPVAVYGFAMFPDVPNNTKSWFLTEEERRLALSRLPRTDHVRMTFSSFRHSLARIASSWQFWLFTALFTIGTQGFEKTLFNEFNLWLKSTNTYTPEQINYYPTITYAFAIVCNFALIILSDELNNRFIINPIMYIGCFISSVMLLDWDSLSTTSHFVAYIVPGIGFAGQASNFAWANTLCRHDDVLRGVTIFAMNLGYYAWVLWYQILCFPVVQAPRFRNGQIGSLVTGAAGVVIAAAISYCARHYPPPILETRSDTSSASNQPLGTGYQEGDEGEKERDGDKGRSRGMGRHKAHGLAVQPVPVAA